MSDEHLQCLYCLQQITAADSPRQLPCGQVGCLQCLLQQVSLPCSCGSTHDKHSIETLPVPPTKKRPADDLADETPPGKCRKQNTVCDNCENLATCYCVYCAKILCPKHEEIHRLFFLSNEQQSKTHKVISVEEYETRPNFFLRPLCQEHQLEISLCCIKCSSMKCSQCKTDNEYYEANKGHLQTTSISSGFGADQNQPKCLRNHIFATLKDVEENLKYVLVKDCSSKIKELFDLEKTTWNKLDSLEEECENLTNAVREKIERVGTTMNTGQELIKKIKQWRLSAVNEVEQKLCIVRAMRDDYDTKMKEYHEFVSKHHVIDLIDQRPRLECLLNVDDAKLPETKEPKICMLNNEVSAFLKGNPPLQSLPNTLKRPTILCFEESGDCKSVSFAGNDMLVALFPHRVKICTVYQPYQKKTLCYSGFSAIASTDQLVYMLHEDKQISVQMIAIKDALASYKKKGKPCELFTIDRLERGVTESSISKSPNMSSPSSNTDPLEASSFRCLLVSESYIIVVIGNVVVAYHKESKQQCHQLIAAPLDFMSVTLCDENSILVLNRTDFKLSSTITKYSIVTTGQGPRIYKQQYFGIERHLTGWASNAKDMCTYDQNTYLVNVHSSLRIMSEEGALLRKLSSDRLISKTLLRMAAKGHIVVILDTENKIKLYHLS